MVIRHLSYCLLSLLSYIIVQPVSLHATDNLTGTLNPAFRTLQVYAGQNPLNDPVITLDSDNTVTVEFDELSDDVRYMRYSVTHCNADWTPSALVESEYIDGFNQAYITDYEFSRATTVHYIHYSLSIPNDEIRLTCSGNYLLRVYDESDPDITLLQTRFMVTEQSVALSGSVSSRTDIDYNGAHQQLSLTIDASRLSAHDLFNDFNITVTQNGRHDNARTIAHPLRIQGKTLVYEHLPQLIFPAGNEYRRFENISTHSPSMNIDHVEWHSPYYHAFLHTDTPRATEPYLYDQTQNGRFIIREYNSSRSDTEADYILTHFSLSTDPIEGADIYIDGDLVSRRFDGSSRLTYNSATLCYETTLLLKQGSYNYNYLVRYPNSTEAFTAPVEGDFYNTINKYDIAVYRRLPGDRYDRLAGYYTIIQQ